MHNNIQQYSIRCKEVRFLPSSDEQIPKNVCLVKAFSMSLPRLQNHITNSKFWKNCNQNGERSQFIKMFSLQSWVYLPEREKRLHSLLNCAKCEANAPIISSMHASISSTTQNIISKTSKLASEIQNFQSKRLADGPEQIVKILEPIVQKTFNKSFRKTVSLHYNLTGKIASEEKHRRKIQDSK